MAAMARMPFAKYQALGNDFVIVESLGEFRSKSRAESPRTSNATERLSVRAIQKLGDRRLGIGFDQLLVVRTLSHAQVELTIFNADGSRARNCGNGLRAVGAYFFDTRKWRSTRVCYAAGMSDVEVLGRKKDTFDVQATMPRGQVRDLALKNAKFCSVGNPHVVVEVHGGPAALDRAFESQAPRLARKRFFGQFCNIEFVARHPRVRARVPARVRARVRVQARARLMVRVFERGVGETLACGSGAVAVASVTGVPATIDFPGGRLEVRQKTSSASEEVTLRGAVVHVFSGTI